MRPKFRMGLAQFRVPAHQTFVTLAIRKVLCFHRHIVEQPPKSEGLTCDRAQCAGGNAAQIRMGFTVRSKLTVEPDQAGLTVELGCIDVLVCLQAATGQGSQHVESAHTVNLWLSDQRENQFGLVKVLSKHRFHFYPLRSCRPSSQMIRPRCLRIAA